MLFARKTTTTFFLFCLFVVVVVELLGYTQNQKPIDA